MSTAPEESPLVSGFEHLVVHKDRSTGTEVLLCIHDTRLGPAFGGIRRMSYPDTAAALRDAVSLATAMTRKCASAGLAAGGGKMVILDPVGWQPGDPRRAAAYRLAGDLVEQMNGQFHTGPDVGTSASDLEHVAARTDHVAAGHLLEAGERTAQGVCAGILAVLAHLQLAPEQSRVAIQGVGSVGAALARRLAARGVEMVLADLVEGRARELAEELRRTGLGPVETVPAATILEQRCDVLAPCALGGVLDLDVVPRLRCRAVAGAANNVLSSAAAGRALFDRGILFAPDHLLNAGALITGVLRAQPGGGRSDAEIHQAIEAIGPRVAALLDRSRKEGLPPEELADRPIERANTPGNP